MVVFFFKHLDVNDLKDRIKSALFLSLPFSQTIPLSSRHQLYPTSRTFFPHFGVSKAALEGTDQGRYRANLLDNIIILMDRATPV